MINGCDVRLAFDVPSVSSSDYKLVVGGYQRVRGPLPLMRLARVVNDDGEPVAYRRLGGVDLLRPEWRAVCAQLPDVFRFKDAKPHFDDSSDKTASFLAACVAAGVLRHDPTMPPKDAYRKVMPVATTASPARAEEAVAA